MAMVNGLILSEITFFLSKMGTYLIGGSNLGTVGYRKHLLKYPVHCRGVTDISSHRPMCEQ